MTLLLLAVLPSVVALVLLALLGLAVLWRTCLGERWHVCLSAELPPVVLSEEVAPRPHPIPALSPGLAIANAS